MQMRENCMQQNPQFLRTDKAIKQALITLLKSKPFEKITVQDILDETPVTRSTFYKHFHDKYEIVERMQDEFFDSQLELSVAVHQTSKEFPPSLINLSKQNNELMEALLKVHTEKVDLRDSLAKQCAEYYLSYTDGPTAHIEADIFAQAITAFRLSSPLTDSFSFEYMYKIFISAFMKILGISDDEDLSKALLKRATEPPVSMSNNEK